MGDRTENIDFSSQTDTADETDVTCLIEPLTSLFDSTAVNLGNDDLTSLCKDIYSKVDDKRNQNTSSLLNQFMLYTTTPNVPTITYGQENEKKELGLNIKP